MRFNRPHDKFSSDNHDRFKSEFNKYGVSINPVPDAKLRNIDTFLGKERGTLELSLLERDGDNATYNAVFNSKGLDKPIEAQFDVTLRNEKVIDNPMETVIQATDFLKEVSDTIHKSKGRTFEIQTGKEIKSPEPDYMDYEAFAHKIQERINVSLAYGMEVSNNYEVSAMEQDRKFSNPKLMEKPRNTSSMSMSM